MALYDRVAELPLVIEDVDFETRVVRGLAAVHAQDDDRGAARGTRQRGAGFVGSGEDVTYDARRARPRPARPGSSWPGSWTIDSLSEHLDGRDLFPRGAPAHGGLPRLPPLGVRVGGARPRALQAGRSLDEALGRDGAAAFASSPRPERPRSRAGSSSTRICASSSTRRRSGPTSSSQTLAARGNVDVVDLKGAYHGTPVDNPPDADLYRRVVELLPDAWIEDPALDARDRRRARSPTATGSPGMRPIHSWARRRGAPVPATLPQLQAVALRLARAAVRVLRPLRRARDRALRRRPVRARGRPRPDPAARGAVPPGRPQRRRARRLQRARAPRRPPHEPARPAPRRGRLSPSRVVPPRAATRTGARSGRSAARRAAPGRSRRGDRRRWRR